MEILFVIHYRFLPTERWCILVGLKGTLNILNAMELSPTFILEVVGVLSLSTTRVAFIRNTLNIFSWSDFIVTSALRVLCMRLANIGRKCWEKFWGSIAIKGKKIYNLYCEIFGKLWMNSTFFIIYFHYKIWKFLIFKMSWNLYHVSFQNTGLWYLFWGNPFGNSWLRNCLVFPILNKTKNIDVY